MGIFKRIYQFYKIKTFQNFTILLIDDTSNKKIRKRIIKELKLIYFRWKRQGNINRIIGLKYIQKNKKNFDIVVFATPMITCTKIE